MKTITLTVLALSSLTAFAGEAPKAPAIPDAQRALFFKAQAEYANAQMAAKTAADAVTTAQTGLNAQIKELQEACGPLWEAQLDRDHNPFCAAKPVVNKPEEKPAK